MASCLYADAIKNVKKFVILKPPPSLIRYYSEGGIFLNRIQIEEAIEEHGEHLLKIAYFIVKNRATAEDIVQDVFVQLLGKTKYEERGQQRAYLTKLTANRSKDYLRSWRYRMTQLIGPSEKTSSAQQRDELQVLEEKYEIGHAILQLPLKYREPIIYYYYEQWPLIEIANHLHIPLNTVKTHLRKGRELLRQSLEKGKWEVLLDESMEG